MNKILLLLLSVTLFSCANQQYPTGGPVDSEPPKIKEASIPTGTTGFSDDEITFTFDEYMNKSTVQTAVFISPSVGNKYKLLWSGKEMTLRFQKDLKPNVTYVVTIGASAGDYRAGNKMLSSYRLAFSTGDQIDSARIKGQAFFASDFKPAAGALVLAYNLADTTKPDPEKSEANYITQVGKDGSFELTYLAPGKYRIFVLDDQVKNERWDVNQESIGIGENEFLEAGYSQSSVPVWFLEKSDKQAPMIQGVVQESQVLLRLTFDEILNLAVSNPRFLLKKESGDSIRTGQILPSFTSPEQVYLPIDSLGTGTFTLIQKGIRDLRMNESVGDTFTFSIVEAVKREKLLRVQSPSDTSSTLLSTDSLKMLFASPVKLDSVRFFTKPTKSQVTKGKKIKVQMSAESGIIQTVSPETRWIEKSTVKGLVFAGQDTVSFQFNTFDPDETGTILGTLESVGQNFPVYLSLYSINRSKQLGSVKTSGSAFKIENLQAGRYLVNGYQDLNGNNKWDGGSVFPWSPAEPKYSVTDTLRVRARWSVEDVVVKKW